jgi:hypothetical protein
VTVSPAKSASPRPPDLVTPPLPPGIHFTGTCSSAPGQPDAQHPADLQVAEGSQVVLKWSVDGAFTSVTIDSVPAGYGPHAVGPSGESEPISVHGDIRFRLNVTAHGVTTRRFLNLHSHPAGHSVSGYATVHAPPEETTDIAQDAILNVDLCILAYQLYHQTVIWALDPWYEVLARGGTSRREHFMAGTHEYAKKLPDRTDDLYAGPAHVGALGVSNAKLDPVLSNYMHIRPRDPALTGDGAVYMALQAPPYIVQRIRKASVAYYSGPWQAEWPHGPTTIREVIDYGSGDDELIAFEGGTGVVDKTEAAYSLLGYVLKRTRADGGWDAHIAFRGSRSGNAVRAALEALEHGGNADWVSDMAGHLIEDPYYNGAVSTGFGAALKRCMGTIRAALLKLDQKYGAPKSIQITGHSLGAALASLCASALLQGIPGAQLSKELDGWNFSKLRGYFNALPPAATQKYAENLLKLAPGRLYAPYVADDIVVQVSHSVPLKDQGLKGLMIERLGGTGWSLGQLDRMPRPPGTSGLDNSHEIVLIRAGLIDKRLAAGKPVSAEVKSASPWGYFVTFMDLLDAKAVNFIRGEKASIVTRANLRKVLQNYRFAQHFRPFLSMLKDVVGDPRAYRGFHRESFYKEAAERFAHASSLASVPITASGAANIAAAVEKQAVDLLGFKVTTDLVHKGWHLVKEAAHQGGGAGLEVDGVIGSDFGARIGLGLVLAAFEEQSSVTIADFAKVPALKLCLEAVLHDASKDQKKAAHTGR